MSKLEAKVKHTPLTKSEKFWETVPSSSSQVQTTNDETIEGLLKSIIDKLDTIINKMEK